MGRNNKWLILAVTVIAAAGFFLLTRASDPTPGSQDSVSSSGSIGPETGDTSPAMLEARAGLLDSPQDVDLAISVRVPPGSDADDDDKQELDASGTVDLADGTANLAYDFKGLNNAGGFLGHLEEMDTLWADGVGYLGIFIDGPRWVQIEPSDAVGTDIDRLRDVIVTTPLGVPGFLGAPGDGDDSRRDVEVASLAASEDTFAAQVGAVLEGLGTDTVEVEIHEDDEITISFSYPAPESPTNEVTVSAVYTFTPSDGDPEVQIPDDSEVRQFSDIFG